MEIIALADNIFYTKELLSKELCESILEKYHQDSHKQRGHTVNSQGERKVDDYAKVSDDLEIAAEGGETCFQKQNLKVKPTAGDALFFPTFWTHMHCGETPRSNDKFVISSFVRFVFCDSSKK